MVSVQKTEEPDTEVKLYDCSDKFFDILWEKIDKAKTLAWVCTYDMDHKAVAGITLQKLINAAKRGVCVILVIDDINYFPSFKQIDQLKAAGGMVVRNNPMKMQIPDCVKTNSVPRICQRNH